MNKSKILTSMLAIMIAGPALAETFPTDGYMQEDTTYDDAATYANTGVYEGSVTATAEYEDILYPIAMGKYLAKNTTIATKCPAGSYCEGLTNALYNETTDQGITSCPTDYASSAAGATSINECYTSCTVANANIAHATAVSGNDYYGTGTDTCEPTACENGWHVKEAEAGLNLASTIGTGDVSYYAWINNSNTFTERGYAWDSKPNKGQNYYGITDNMSFALGYETKGIVTGVAKCSETNGDFLETTGTPSNTHGNHCWCKVTGYTPVNGPKQELSALWVFSDDGDYSSIAESQCDDYCPMYCATLPLGYGSSFTSFLFSTVSSSVSSLASCEANTITINWTDAAYDSEATSSTVYEGDIKTPSAAKTKPGKTFKGWIFNKTSN